MATVNERLHDESVAHAVDLVRYSNGEVRRLIALLNRVDADLAAQLLVALERLPAGEANVERIDALLDSVRRLNAQVYAQFEQELTGALRQVAGYEAGYQLELFRSVIPPQVVSTVGLAQVSAEQAFAAAMARPFQGRLLREWAQGIGEARMARIRDAVRMGYVEQESVGQIVRRIRGTRAQNYADGLLEIDRRGAEAVVRTAIGHTAGYTRGEFYSANSDLVASQQWAATLDTRTSEVCRVRDGKRWTCVDHKPIGHKLEWLGGPGRAHWQCRSTAVPVVKSWAELGIDLPEVPASTRASMDGQVAEDVTFGAWLKRQTASRQDDVLGATRGALFRRGGLTIEQFYNDKGRHLSLDDLRRKDAEAFARAGVQ